MTSKSSNLQPSKYYRSSPSMEHCIFHRRRKDIFITTVLPSKICDRICTEEVRQGQKVINEMIMCLYKPNGDHTWGFFTAVPRAFITVINSLDSPDNMLTNNALYPWGTSVGKDKHGLSIGSAKVKHERNAIMQHRANHAPVFKLHPVQLPVEPPKILCAPAPARPRRDRISHVIEGAHIHAHNTHY